MASSKLLGFPLALMVAMVLGGTASAHEFHTETAPARLEGAAITPVYFKTGVSFYYECQSGESSLEGTASKTAFGSLILNPLYQNCRAPETVIKLTVVRNGCGFSLQGATGEKGHAQFAIQCEAGKSLELQVESESGLYCTAKISSQTSAGGVVYENQGWGSSRDFKVTMTATGIAYTTSGGFLNCQIFFGNGKDLALTGTYTIQGFQDGGSGQIGAWVS